MKTKRFIAAGLAALTLIQPALNSSAQASLWTDRQDAARTRLASAAGAGSARSVLTSLPAARRSALINPVLDAPSSLGPILAALPAGHVQVRSVLSGAGTPVLILQDVHLNGEAQAHLAAALESVANANTAGVIGVEGAFGDFSLNSFRAFPNRRLTRAVVDDYLAQGLIAGAPAAGILSEAPAPLQGIDDAALYEANVRAYLDARRSAPAAAAALETAARVLSDDAARVLNPDQKHFLGLWDAYRDSRRGLDAYLQALVKAGAAPTLQATTFLSASALESALNFPAVERERGGVIEKLAARMNAEDVKALTRSAMDYRAGALGHAAFYAQLKALCQRHGVDLARAPSFAAYLRYVALADSIRAETLFDDVRAMEAAAWSHLAPSREQSAILERHQLLSFEKGLSRFTLTPEEWASYRALRKTHPSSLPDAASVEAFYENADRRSEAMVKNLLALPATGARVMVIGGFHTPHVLRLLRARGLACAVATPRLTKVDGDASAYLSIFAREKTPLEQWVRGETLHVNPLIVELGTPAAAAEGAALSAILGGAHVRDGQAMPPAATNVTITSFDSTGASIDVATPDGPVHFRAEYGAPRTGALRTAGDVTVYADDRSQFANRFGSRVAGWVSLIGAVAVFYGTSWVVTLSTVVAVVAPSVLAAAPWVLSAMFASGSALYFAQGAYFKPSATPSRFRKLDPVWAKGNIDVSGTTAADPNRGPAYVINGQIYADRARLAELPLFLQRSIYWHERTHQRFPFLGELGGYGAQGIHLLIAGPWQPVLAAFNAVDQFLVPRRAPAPATVVEDPTPTDGIRRMLRVDQEIRGIVRELAFPADQVETVVKALIAQRKELTDAPHVAGRNDGLADQTEWPETLRSPEQVAALAQRIIAQLEQAILTESHTVDLPWNIINVAADRAAFLNRLRGAFTRQHAELLRRAQINAGEIAAPAPPRAPRPVDVTRSWILTMIGVLPVALVELASSAISVLRVVVPAVIAIVWAPVSALRTMGGTRGGAVLAVTLGAVLGAVLSPVNAAIVISLTLAAVLAVLALLAPVANRSRFRAEVFAYITVALSATAAGRAILSSFERPVDEPVIEQPIEQPQSDNPGPTPDGKGGPALTPPTPPEALTLAKQMDAMIADVRAGVVGPEDPRVAQLLVKGHTAAVKNLETLKEERDRKARLTRDRVDLNRRLNSNLYAAVVAPDGRVAMNGGVPATFERAEDLAAYLYLSGDRVEYRVHPTAIPALKDAKIEVAADGRLPGPFQAGQVKDLNDSRPGGAITVQIRIRMNAADTKVAELENVARALRGLVPLPVEPFWNVETGLNAPLQRSNERIRWPAQRQRRIETWDALAAQKLPTPEKLLPFLTAVPAPGLLPGPVVASKFDPNPTSAPNPAVALRPDVTVDDILRLLTSKAHPVIETGLDLSPKVRFLDRTFLVSDEKGDRAQRKLPFLPLPEVFLNPDNVVHPTHATRVPAAGFAVPAPDQRPPVRGYTTGTPLPNPNFPQLKLKAGAREFVLPVAPPNAADPTLGYAPGLEAAGEIPVTLENGMPLRATEEWRARLNNVNGESWLVEVNAVTTMRFNPAESAARGATGALADPVEIYILSPEQQRRLLQDGQRAVGALILANGGLKLGDAADAVGELAERRADAEVTLQENIDAAVRRRLDTTDDVLLLNADGTIFDGPEIHLEERMLELADAGRVRIEWSPAPNTWQTLSPLHYRYPLPQSRSAQAIATRAVRFVRVQDDAGQPLPAPKVIFTPDQQRLMAFDALGRPMDLPTARAAAARGAVLGWWVDVDPDGKTAMPLSRASLRDPVHGRPFWGRLKQVSAGGAVAQRLEARADERNRRGANQRRAMALSTVHTIWMYDGPVTPNDPLSAVVASVTDPVDIPTIEAGFRADMKDKIRRVRVSDAVFHLGVTRIETGEEVDGVVLRIEDTKTGKSIRLADGRETGRIDGNAGGAEMTPDGRVQRVLTKRQAWVTSNRAALNELRQLMFSRQSMSNVPWDYGRYPQAAGVSDPYPTGEMLPWNSNFYPAIGKVLSVTESRSGVRKNLVEAQNWVIDYLKMSLRRPGQTRFTDLPVLGGSLYTGWYATPTGLLGLVPDSPADAKAFAEVITSLLYEEDQRSQLPYVALVQSPSGQVVVAPWAHASPAAYDARIKAAVVAGLNGEYDPTFWKSVLNEPEAILPSVGLTSIAQMTVSDGGVVQVTPVYLRSNVPDEMDNARAALLLPSLHNDGTVPLQAIDRDRHVASGGRINLEYPVIEAANKQQTEWLKMADSVQTRPMPGMPRSRAPGYGIPKELQAVLPGWGDDPRWMYAGNQALLRAYLENTGGPYLGWGGFMERFRPVFTGDPYVRNGLEGNVGTPETVGSHLAFAPLGIYYAPRNWATEDKAVSRVGRFGASYYGDAMYKSGRIPPIGLYANTPPVVSAGPGGRPVRLGFSRAPSASEEAYRLVTDPNSILFGTNLGRPTWNADRGPLYGYDVTLYPRANQRGLVDLYHTQHAAAGGAVANGSVSGHTVTWEDGYPRIVPFVRAGDPAVFAAALESQGLTPAYPGAPIRFSATGTNGQVQYMTVQIDGGTRGASEKAARSRAGQVEADEMAKVNAAGKGGLVHVTYSYAADGTQTVGAQAKIGPEAELEFYAVAARAGQRFTNLQKNANDGAVVFSNGDDTWVINGGRLTRMRGDRPLEAWQLASTAAQARAARDVVRQQRVDVGNERRLVREGGTRSFNVKTGEKIYSFGKAAATQGAAAAKSAREKESVADQQAGSLTNSYRDGDRVIQVVAAPDQILDVSELPIDPSMIPAPLRDRLPRGQLDAAQKAFDSLTEAESLLSRARTKNLLEFVDLSEPGSGGGALVLKNGRYDHTERDKDGEPKGSRYRALFAEMRETVGDENTVAKLFQERRYFEFTRRNGEVVILVPDPEADALTSGGMAAVEANQASAVAFALGEFRAGRLPANVEGLMQETYQAPPAGTDPDVINFLTKNLWPRQDAIPGVADIPEGALQRDRQGFLLNVNGGQGVVTHYQVDDIAAKDGNPLRPGSRTLSLKAGVTINVPATTLLFGKVLFTYEFAETAKGFTVTRVTAPTAPEWLPRRPHVTEYEIVTLPNPHGQPMLAVRTVRENDGLRDQKHSFNAFGDRIATDTKILDVDNVTWNPYSGGVAVLTNGRVALDEKGRYRWRTVFAADGRVEVDVYAIGGARLVTLAGAQERRYYGVQPNPIPGREAVPSRTLIFENGVPSQLLDSTFFVGSGETTVDRHDLFPPGITTFPGRPFTFDGENWTAVTNGRRVFSPNGEARLAVEVIRQPDLNRPGFYTVTRAVTEFNPDAAEATRRRTGQNVPQPIRTVVDGQTVWNHDTVLRADDGAMTTVATMRVAEAQRPRLSPALADAMINTGYIRETRPVPVMISGKLDIRQRPTRRVDADGAETTFEYAVANELGMASRVVERRPVPGRPGEMEVVRVRVLTDGQADPANAKALLTVDPETGAPVPGVMPRRTGKGYLRVQVLEMKAPPASRSGGFELFDAAGFLRESANAGVTTGHRNPAPHPFAGTRVTTEARETIGGQTATLYTNTDPFGQSSQSTVPYDPRTQTGRPVDASAPTDPKEDPQNPFGDPRGGMAPVLLRLFGASSAPHLFWIETAVFGIAAALFANPLVWIGANVALFALHFLAPRGWVPAGVRPSPLYGFVLGALNIGAIAATRWLLNDNVTLLAIAAIVAMWAAILALHQRMNRDAVRAVGTAAAAENVKRILSGAPLALDIRSLSTIDRTGRDVTDYSEAFAQRLAASLDAKDGSVTALIPAWDETGPQVRHALTGERRSDNFFGGSLGALMADARLAASDARGDAHAVVPVQYIRKQPTAAAVVRARDSLRRLFATDPTNPNLGMVLVAPNLQIELALRAMLLTVPYGDRVIVIRQNNAERFVDLTTALNGTALADLWSRAEIRLLVPDGVKLPDFFNGVSASDRLRVRLFALLYEAFNGIVIETDSLSNLTDTFALAAQQA